MTVFIPRAVYTKSLTNYARNSISEVPSNEYSLRGSRENRENMELS